MIIMTCEHGLRARIPDPNQPGETTFQQNLMSGGLSFEWSNHAPRLQRLFRLLQEGPTWPFTFVPKGLPCIVFFSTIKVAAGLDVWVRGVYGAAGRGRHAAPAPRLLDS